MKKNKLNEQWDTKRSDLFTTPRLKLMAAANCVSGEYYPKEHPETKKEAIYKKSVDPTLAKNPHIYFTENDTVDIFDDNNKKVQTIKVTCTALKERTNPPTTIVQEELLDLLKNSLGWKYHNEVGRTDIGNWILTDVATDIDLQPNGQFYSIVSGLQQYMNDLKNSGRPFFMWKPKKGMAPQKNIDTEKKRILAKYTSPSGEGGLSYRFCPTNAEIGNEIIIDLGKYYPEYFEKGTKLCKSATKANQLTDNDLEGLKKSASSNEKNACRNIILTYYNLAITKTPKSMIEIDQLKPILRNCINSHEFPFLKKQKDYLMNTARFTTNGIDYDYRLRESVNKVDMIVSESLFKLKVNKSKRLLEERREVRNKIVNLVENNSFKNKRDMVKFSNHLIGEMVNLRREGYNERIIGEQLDSILGGLSSFLGGTGDKDSGILSFLGGKSKSGILSTVVETIVGGLLDNMGIPDGYLKTMIMKTLANISPSDLPKLSDCNYLSGLFTKSILETIAANVTANIGGKSMLGSFVENTLFEMGEETELFQSIKNFLGDKIICPYLEGKGNNLLSQAMSGIMGKN